MANPEHVRLLLEGVTVWNARRSDLNSIPDLRDENIAAQLRDAQLTTEDGKPNLKDVDLSGVLLSGCNFSDTDLSHANLTLADIGQARLNGADLTEAILLGANLRRANLTDCTLVDTQIADADLVGANLTGSRPWQASMMSIFSPFRDLPILDLNAEVTGIHDVLQVSNQLKEYYGLPDECDQKEFYFRGESKNTWELTPSVMRRSGADEYSLRNSECDMLVDLRSRRAEDFTEASSGLDRMVVAQHHGLPTRLLDVTRNPLVALFHASEKSPGADGRLHVFTVPRSMVKPFNNDTISVIANFASLRRNEQNLLLGKTTEETVDDADPGYGTKFELGNYYDLAMNRLHQFIRLEKPSFQKIDPKDLFRIIIVEPQQSIERIRAQSGAFLISAFHERFEEAEVRKWTGFFPLYHHHTLTVPSSNKPAICEELATLNITRETMFPGLEEAAKAVTDRYRRP